jgi:hypothetical protein
MPVQANLPLRALAQRLDDCSAHGQHRDFIGWR